MSMVRKRNAAVKTYIPTNARDNQYILAEFTLTEQLLSQLPIQVNDSGSINYYACYQTLANLLFTLSNDYGIKNSILVANDKLVRVRYSQAMHQWQTKQQIIFYYDPNQHVIQNSFFDANIKAKKITLVFLASGSDIRAGATNFHQEVKVLLEHFAQQVDLPITDIRMRDHQHLTYDIFAKNKGYKTSQAHKFRPIKQRYASQNITLEEKMSSITYGIVDLPLDNRITELVDIDPAATDPYNPLYTYLTNTFSLVAKHFNLNNGALIANGLIPIVRHSLHDLVSKVGEFQILGYNPKQSPCGIVSRWQAHELVDNVQLIFVADCHNGEEKNYAKFVNQIEQAMYLFAKELDISTEKEQLILRFHQHIAYNLSPNN
jgi:hypothetical protein